MTGDEAGSGGVDNKVKMITEGLLLAARRPLTLNDIARLFDEKERPDREELQAVMAAITQDCEGRGFELKQVASGYRFQVRQELSVWIARLWQEKPPRYSRALLETLALIAYRQPVTRGDIEEVRGVGVSSGIIRTLLDREWIRVVGHRDVPGRPAMFATTRQFLDYFNLRNLQQLPPLSEVMKIRPDEQERALEEELATARVIELPEEPPDADGGVGEQALTGDNEEAAALESLQEQELARLSERPLDKLLGTEQEATAEVAEEDTPG